MSAYIGADPDGTAQMQTDQAIVVCTCSYGTFINDVAYVIFIINWAIPCENESSGICRQGRPRSDCTSVQSDPGLHCQQTESLDTTNV